MENRSIFLTKTNTKTSKLVNLFSRQLFMLFGRLEVSFFRVHGKQVNFSDKQDGQFILSSFVYAFRKIGGIFLRVHGKRVNFSDKDKQAGQFVLSSTFYVLED